VMAVANHAERQASMDTASSETAARRPPSRVPLSPTAAVLLAIALGLCGGYLDLGVIVFKKYGLNEEGYFRTARDFPWTVPAGHAVLLMVVGLMVATINVPRRKLVSLRAGAWLFATLATWAALLRLPLYGACSLVLAVGLGRLIGTVVAARGLHPRRLRYVLGALVGLLCVLAGFSSGWDAVREYRTVAGLTRPPSGARNVVLIVWDTVRAYNLGLYGYFRDTSPNLSRWAQKGVRYNRALAPAPWTYPSHSCFFTGQWPFKLNSQWTFKLDTPDPTLAEYLASRGYQTAGFSANTNCCTYETGLDRGFAHFEDYSLTPMSLLTRTVPGKWILENIPSLGDFHGMSLVDFYDKKWIGLQSRGARAINDGFLDWLGRRRSDRPFFAFLNYFDAHEPFVPPSGYKKRFGLGPTSPQDYRFLFDYVGSAKRSIRQQDLLMTRDCYDDCIALLDEQLGRLLDALRVQGLLENTEVIITSDHGESFGDHGSFGHSYTVNLDEVGVPLVILSPGAPRGREVESPVSLRDLPATVVDLLGLSAGSPFPGRSLAAYWGSTPGRVPQEITTPAFSEQADASALQAQSPLVLGNGGFQMSLVASGMHYIRNGRGGEQLYDLRRDPYEQTNLIAPAYDKPGVDVFRRMLLKVLTDNPGSIEAEKAYLKTYRQRLRALVQGPDATLAKNAAD
jgi:arylsulfatase A-like enzyme